MRSLLLIVLLLGVGLADFRLSHLSKVYFQKTYTDASLSATDDVELAGVPQAYIKTEGHGSVFVKVLDLQTGKSTDITCTNLGMGSACMLWSLSKSNRVGE